MFVTNTQIADCSQYVQKTITLIDKKKLFLDLLGIDLSSSRLLSPSDGDGGDDASNVIKLQGSEFVTYKA